MSDSDVTEDWLLNEQVRLFQPKKGYRAGLDAILLASSLDGRPGEHFLELGCGAGGALFPSAHRLLEARFTGVERVPLMVALAKRGIEANRFSDRVNVVEADISQLPKDWENGFDQVFSNPPYFEPGRIQAPHEGRSHAYMADVSLADWLKAMLHAAKPKGRITIIHRGGALGDILSYLMSRTGQIEVYPIRSAPGEAAKRVIVTARKGLRRGDIVLHDGMNMYPSRGTMTYTDEAKRILNGGPLNW